MMNLQSNVAAMLNSLPHRLKMAPYEGHPNIPVGFSSGGDTYTVGAGVQANMHPETMPAAAADLAMGPRGMAPATAAVATMDRYVTDESAAPGVSRLTMATNKFNHFSQLA